MKQRKKSDGYGIASVDFRLATIVNMGTFKMRALLGKATGEKTVEVSRYVLPKFDVKIARRQGVVRGRAEGQRHDRRALLLRQAGERRARVARGAHARRRQNVFQQVMGMTDANGHMAFSVTLPHTLAGIPLQDGNALVTLRATVTDTAQQEVRKELAMTVAANPVQALARARRRPRSCRASRTACTCSRPIRSARRCAMREVEVSAGSRRS